MSILDSGSNAAFTAVFVQTNEQGAHRVLAFRRSGGRHARNRRGSTGPAHLTDDADGSDLTRSLRGPVRG